MSEDASPPTIYVEIELKPPGRGVYKVESLLGGVVNTERGQCFVELGTVEPAPQHESAPQPVTLNVMFRTTDHPLGVHLQFDATNFLEEVVQEYLRERPTEVPIARPRNDSPLGR